MSITSETFRKIQSTRSHKKASKLAFDACKSYLDQEDITANGLDNGYSMTAKYEMPDGGVIWLDGMGWHMSEA